MNQNSLAIYSFLMANDLEFSRVCHDEYHDRNQWKQLLKKIRTEVCYPQCMLYQEISGSRFLLMLTPENAPSEGPEGWTAVTESQRQELCSRLRCRELSPLALFFDTEHQFVVKADPELCKERLWWLSPCSEQSSVLMTPEAVLHQFLPKIGTEVL